MTEIGKLLKPQGKLVVMERMGDKAWSGAWRLQVSKTAGDRPAARNERLRFSARQ
jgi:hypothetical protein